MHVAYLAFSSYVWVCVVRTVWERVEMVVFLPCFSDRLAVCYARCFLRVTSLFSTQPTSPWILGASIVERKGKLLIMKEKAIAPITVGVGKQGAQYAASL